MALVSLPKHPNDLAWPSETWPEADLPGAVDRSRFDPLITQAFSNPPELGETHALVVVQNGALVFERYGETFGPDQTYPSWSMAKSMTHALIGIAIKDGKLDPAMPVPVPAWADANDPRGAITWDHLLQMASGLEFCEEYADAGVSDTIEMLFGGGKSDVAAYATNKPLEHAPGTHWSYSSGTTNILCQALSQQLGLDKNGFERFMWDRLLTPIGMRSAIPKFDAAGTFIGSSFCFCSARDFARFGLLYLRDGIWNGTRLLPDGWVDHARTPVPFVPEEEPMGYGGHWWLNLAGEGSFSANGYMGQYIVLVPQKDLILVRHGASEDQKDNVRAWLSDLASCF